MASTPPGVKHGHKRTASASRESQNAAIWISDDGSDTKDKDDIGSDDINSPQSRYITPTSTGITDDSHGTNIKHSVTESDTGPLMGSRSGLFSAPVEGIGVSLQESPMDIYFYSKSNYQTLRRTLCTPIRDKTRNEDIGSVASLNGHESQLCLDRSNDQLSTEATGKTSKTSLTTDALSDEDCYRFQYTPSTPSTHVYSPTATTLETMDKTPIHNKETCMSSLCDDAILEVTPSSYIENVSSKPQKDQDLNHGSCSSNNAESSSSEAQFPSAPEAQVSSPRRRTPFARRSRRSRRISPFTLTQVQDRDSGIDSGDGLNITGIDNEEYRPSPPQVQEHGSEEDLEDEGRHCRKHRRASRSPLALTLSSSPASGCSRNIRSARCIAQQPREHLTSSICDNRSPASSQAIPVALKASSFLIQYEG